MSSCMGCTTCFSTERDWVLLYPWLPILAVAYLCPARECRAPAWNLSRSSVEARLQPSPGLHEHGKCIASYAMRSGAARCLHVVGRGLQQASRQHLLTTTSEHRWLVRAAVLRHLFRADRHSHRDKGPAAWLPASLDMASAKA